MIVDLASLRRVILAVVFVLMIIALLNSRGLWRRIYPFPHQEIVVTQAQDKNLSPFLVAAVIRVESGFDPRAVSNKGAVGLMQVLPTTAQWLAEKEGGQGLDPELLFEPETNIKFGTLYLSWLRQEFGPNLVVILASYNAGHNRVREWLNGGVWDGRQDTVGKIPILETRSYVFRVMADFQRYRDIWGNDIADPLGKEGL